VTFYISALQIFLLTYNKADSNKVTSLLNTQNYK